MSLQGVSQAFRDPPFLTGAFDHREAKEYLLSDKAASIHEYCDLRTWLSEGAPLRYEAYRVALGFAALEGSFHVVKLLLDQGGWETDEALKHAFVSACMGAQIEVMEFLHKEKSCVDAESAGDGLQAALCVLGNQDEIFTVVDFLLERRLLREQELSSAADLAAILQLHSGFAKLLIESVRVLNMSELAVKMLVKNRHHIGISLFESCAQVVLDFTCEERKKQVHDRLFYSARCLDMPSEYRFHFKLPPLPSNCGLAPLLKELGRFDASESHFEAESLLRRIEASSVATLLSATRIAVLSMEAYQTLSSVEQQAICDKFRTYNFAMGSERGHTFEDYQKFIQRAHRNHEKLVYLLKGKFAARQTRALHNLGTPNPLRDSEGFIRWHQQIFEQLAHLENFRQGLLRGEQEELIFEILASVHGDAGEMQASIYQLFKRHISMVSEGTLVEQLFVRNFARAHQRAVDRVKLALGRNAHELNDIDACLSRFGFYRMEMNGISTELDGNEAVELFHVNFDCQELVRTIIEDFQKELETKQQFLELFDLTVDEKTIVQIEKETEEDASLPRLIQEAEEEFAKRFVQRGASRLTQAELRVVPQGLLDSSLRQRYQQLWGASASAASPTFEDFAQEARSAALPLVLKQLSSVHHFAKATFKEICDRKIEEQAIEISPMLKDGSIDPRMILGWLCDKNFLF